LQLQLLIAAKSIGFAVETAPRAKIFGATPVLYSAALCDGGASIAGL